MTLPRKLILLLLALLLISGVTLLCSLGFWQLSRYQQKLQWLNQAEQNEQATPLNATQLLALPSNRPALESYRFHPAKLTGTFNNEYVILLDNKIYKGQAGYDVLVPLALDERTWILINRGWIPLGSSRQKLPTLPGILGEVTIEGYVDFAYRNPLITSNETTHIQWPLRLQQLDLPLLSAALGKTIYPMLVTLKTDSPYAFRISPPKQTWLTPERHLGYAVQWFALAGTLLICVAIWLMRRNKLR